jgi:2-oxoglutarate ferredoxin oxidoreductase subunit beta
LKAALRHRGLSVLDIISPCVTFNDFSSSTKSWEWAKENELPLQELGFVPRLPEIEVEQQAGAATRVQLHDGSWITLRALRHDEHKVTDRGSAMRLLAESNERSEFLTGLIYLSPERPNFVDMQEMTETPLCRLPDEALRPSRETLMEIMARI